MEFQAVYQKFYLSKFAAIQSITISPVQLLLCTVEAKTARISIENR